MTMPEEGREMEHKELATAAGSMAIRQPDEEEPGEAAIEVIPSALVLVERADEIEIQERQAFAFLEEAHLFGAVDAYSYELGIERTRDLRHRRKQIVEFFLPMREPAHKAWKAITARQAEVEAPIVTAIEVYEREISRYRTLQAQIAAQRAAEERARFAEEAQKARDAAFDKAVEAGDEAKAEAILDNVDAPAAVSPEASVEAQVEAAAPKVKNVVTKEVWTGEVVDLKLFLSAVVERIAPEHLIAVDQAALNRFAAQNRGTAKIPGVKFSSESKVTVRS